MTEAAACLLYVAVCAPAAAGPILDTNPETKRKIRDWTRNEKTPAARADKLLRVARLIEDNKALRANVLDHALDWGLSGELTLERVRALKDAASSLNGLVPDRLWEWRARSLDLYRRWYHRAAKDDKGEAGTHFISELSVYAKAFERDDRWADAATALREAKTVAITTKRTGDSQYSINWVTRHHVRAKHYADVQTKTQGYERIVKNPPDNAAIRQKLLKELTVGMDNAPEAMKHLTDAAGERWNAYLPLAAGKVDALDATACHDLGRWYYRELGRGADDYTTANALYRATIYYERFDKDLVRQKDARTVDVRVDLEEIIQKLKALKEKGIEPLRRKVVQGDEWIDLLKLIDPKKHTIHGTWVRKGDAIEGSGKQVMPEGYPRVAIPVALTGSYEVEGKFTRTEGSETVGLTFPAGRGRLSLTLGASVKGKTPFSGLMRIGGRDAGSNATTVRSVPLVNGKEYTVHIRVDLDGEEADIAVDLDGKKFIRWKGKQASLTAHPDRRIPGEYVLGLFTGSPTVFHSWRLRTVVKDEWIDMLKRIDTEGDAVWGKWESRGSELHGSGTYSKSKGYPRMMLPASPRGSYEIQMEFTRRNSKDRRQVSIVLPIGEVGVAVTLDSGNHVHRLSRLDGTQDHKNEATYPRGKLLDGRRYRAAIVVRPDGDKVDVTVTLNDKRIISWSGAVSRLKVPDLHVLPERGRLGLSTGAATTFHSVKLRMLPEETE